MKFAEWVPEAVRVFIESAIEGHPPEAMGWAKALANIDKQFTDIKGEIKKRTQRGETEVLDSLRRFAADVQSHRMVVAEAENCLRRLGTDARMRDAYKFLATEFTEGRQWCGFIHSAWFARTNYKRYRDRLVRTKELRDHIAKNAGDLAKLLRKASDIFASDWPSEFFSVHELLQKTDNHEMQDRNLAKWKYVRPYIVGDPPKFDIPDFEQTQRGADSTHLASWTYFSGRARQNPWHIWEVAPPLSALLETVAKVAKAYEPKPEGIIASAISSRKKNSKAEYLRAFVHLLFEEHHWRSGPYNIAPTNAVKNAMAIAAIVAIDHPNIDVSPDDVRKAIKKIVPLSQQAHD